MGMYVSVRGWIELDHRQRQDAERIIERSPDDHYSGGWGWPQKPFNWTLNLFYGGDIRESAIPEIRDQVKQLALLPPTDEDGDRPRGLFIVNDERGHIESWQVQHGEVLSVPAPQLGWLAT